MVIVMYHTLDGSTASQLMKAVAQHKETIKIVDVSDSGTINISTEDLIGRIKTLALPLENEINVEQEMLKMQEEQRKQRERSQPHRFKHKKHNYFG